MSNHEPLGRRASQPLPRYQGNRISGNATVQLGDIYNLSRENPLSLLPFAENALFDSYARQHEPPCLPNTRVDVLQKISQWADSEDQQCLFWLSGMAGTGKSTIAHTVARAYLKQDRLAATFFFSRGGGDAGHARKFVTTIALQLAVRVPPVQRYICDAVTEHINVASKSLAEQWRQLVFQPLSKLDGSNTYVLVIHALDECEGEEDMQVILQLLAEARSLKRVTLRVLITSRPEVPIRYGFRQIPDAEHHDFILHDIEAAIVDHDILIFLEQRLRAIREKWMYSATWPSRIAIDKLVQKSSGLFIWATTACRFIGAGEELAEDRLDEILEGSSSNATPEQHLNQMYLTILRSSIPTTLKELEKVQLYARQQRVLGTIIVLSSPLSAASLDKLLNFSQGRVKQTLGKLSAIIDVPKESAGLVRVHHPSFRDFLLNKDRCSEPNFWVDERQAHQSLANSCIQLMSTSLKQDVCRQKAPGTLVANVASSQIEHCLPPEVRYACLYWIQHLQNSGVQLYDNGQVHQFFQIHLLHWFEALGWIGKTSEGILAIISLEEQILANKSPNLHAFIYDAKRFALYNRSVIEQAPLQLYRSALVFSPEKSIVRSQFKECITWIQPKPKIQANWNAALQTLTGHASSVWSVAFSPDGKQVVSGSSDKTVRLWDAATGAALQTLTGHADSVRSVAFSPDGKQVVSGSDDKTVRLWDAATGAALQTLTGHADSVRSVAFSPDGKQVVSGSDDKTVRLWDAATGAALQTLTGHADSVRSVAFSPDGKQVVSGSDDKTVRLWDAATGAALQTLTGHADWVWSVAFSPDGKQVVSGSDDKTVRLWDAATGAALQTLTGHADSVWSVAFSPDGKQVVSGSSDKTVRLWDAATGAALQTLTGHASSVRSVAFSPDGKQVVSGSDDKTVRLWDAATGAALQTLTGHASSVWSVAFSPDGKQVVSGSDDKTVRLWDAATGAALQTLTGHADSVRSVAFSPDGKLLPTLLVSNGWVVEGGTKILWLPPGDRLTICVAWKKIIVLGYSSGRLSIIGFQEGSKVL